MFRLLTITGVLVASLVLMGCHSIGYTVPVTRDYHHLAKAKVCEAENLVASAHRVGAERSAPYSFLSSTAWLSKEGAKPGEANRATNYFLSAKEYLRIAKQERAEGDWAGARDYAGLSKEMAEKAIQYGAVFPDKGPKVVAKDHKACVAEFDRVKARWAELDPQKAAEVAPGLYAEATAFLSHAEHELNEWYDTCKASRCLAMADATIDTILAQDVDGDGVVDMKDGAPMDPEDKDGFEDADGIPDLDNDKDGIWDHDDKKPLEPETFNRWHDEDGAPDSYPPLESIHFSSGSAILSSDAKGYLRGITQLVVEWPEIKLHVAGHTDSTASEAYNDTLSKKRADHAADYLKKHGCPSNQLVVTSHGESQPMADNKTAKGKAANRRVDLKLE